MGQPAEVANLSASRPLKSGHVQILVRVAHRRTVTTQEGRIFLSLGTLPAPDAYSSPQTLEVHSKLSIGGKDEEVHIECRLGGFRRTFKAADKETGEIQIIATADNKLYLIEE